MSIKEDDLTKVLIKNHESDAEYFEDLGEVNIFPEAHYSHYGNRGVADLYVYVDPPMRAPSRGDVYEIKSEAAVRQATGPNEIVRQFNRMREFFFEGSSHTPPGEVAFELCFIATEKNIRHIADYADIYSYAVSNKLTNIDVKAPSYIDPTRETELHHVFISLRKPDCGDVSPIILFSGGENYLEGVDGSTFSEKAKSDNRDLYFEFQEVIDEISA
ncbi:hypothetical protein [Natronorubrum bangense]|uniref:hypothetical protein n=1 Tax=Natronorubrum bangense TaxID=61858 RepID=UPI0010A3598B|nr:hypothetical protein [Natronorubrum bangense]